MLNINRSLAAVSGKRVGLFMLKTSGIMMCLMYSEDEALRFQPLSQEPQEEELPISRSSSLVSRPDLSSCGFHHALRTRVKVEIISSVYVVRPSGTISALD
jgi:hypothetical protein